MTTQDIQPKYYLRRPQKGDTGGPSPDAARDPPSSSGHLAGVNEERGSACFIKSLDLFF